ncbi:hypothetical protein BH18ACT4_BH18ACT4_11670 [soil metagenome]
MAELDGTTVRSQTGDGVDAPELLEQGIDILESA